MAASVAHSQLAARHSSLAGDAAPTLLRPSSLAAQAVPSRPSSAAKKAASLCVRSSSAQQNSQEESVLGQVARGAASLALAGLLSLSPIAANIAPAAAAPTALNPAISDVSVLIKGQPIKDAKALLRYALPITNQPIKDVQLPLELISEDLRVPGVKALDGVERNIRQANRILNQNKAKILADVNPDKKAEGEALVERLQDGLQEFQRIVERKDRGAVPAKQKELLAIVGDIEEAMVLAFPFEIPDELKDYPWLRGRATLEMVVNPINNRNVSEYVMEIVVDGYNAPISAGNFVDLVQRGFYNGMEIQRADGFVVQTGDPDGPSEGFVDPKTGKVRNIPLEVFAEGDKAPIYHETLEELGRYKALSRLPFNAFGTMAMAREEFDNDSASSQVFWLLKESELTPSSANILDGRYAVFGYITENEELLADLKVGDVIKSITVKQGLDNLVNPTY